MNYFKHNNLLAVAIVLLAGALVTSGVGGMLFGADFWLVRLTLLGACPAVAGVLVILWMYHQNQSRKAAERYVEALCRLDPCELRSDDIPPLSSYNPWYAIADHVRQTVLNLSGQVQDLEHTCAASEIRIRRATDECLKIKKIFSELSEPIVVIDDYDELVLANNSADDLLQLDAADETENRVLAEVVRCQKLVELLKTASRRKTTGNRTDEIEITDRHGQSRWYRATAAKLSAAVDESDGDASAASGAVAVLRDIGDQKELQKCNAEFVSAVSHEMKTPLAGIKAYVELLADGDAEDEQTQEEFLGIISSQADRLQRLVDNMLNIARIEAGVVNVSKQTRSLNELLEEALHVVQPAAEAKQIELVEDLSPMYLGVLADRDMLLQAAINLLGNAVKYTPNGGKVTLRSRMVDQELRFEVQDTGVGLSEEDARRVFEKFYCVKKDKTMATGTGLGLPLAKHIVEDVHSGRLTVESTLGEGSIFAITLPNAGQINS